MCVGHPADFDAWVAEGCAGWGYADLMPYFLRSEHYTPGASAHHAVGGPLHLIRPSAAASGDAAYMAAGAEIGIAPTDDHNGARMSGPCLNTLTIKDGKRQTIADAYLAPALGAAEPASHGARRRCCRWYLDGARCRGVRLSDRHGARDADGRARRRRWPRDDRLADAADALGHRPGR